jgi:hypothetical protein
MTYAFLDFETRKVDLPEPFVYDADRRPVTKRWQVFMAGICLSNSLITLFEGDEQTVFAKLGDWLDGYQVDTIVYEATRYFDEMIAKGRFINARREFLPTPGPWPYASWANHLTWINLGPRNDPKQADHVARNAAKLYESQPQLIRDHCYSDVVGLRERWRRGQS